MADRTSIERIAKILARANSDNVGEGETALLGAYARMNRDGVTFTDLLSLPERDLYQDALVRLAEHIVKEQADLSPSQKRTLYAEYLKRIVEKFSPGSGGRAGESSPRKKAEDEQTNPNREREEAARAYEERRRQEEARRARSAPPPRREQQKTEPPPHDNPRHTDTARPSNQPPSTAPAKTYSPPTLLEHSINGVVLFVLTYMFCAVIYSIAHYILFHALLAFKMKAAAYWLDDYIVFSTPILLLVGFYSLAVAIFVVRRNIREAPRR